MRKVLTILICLLMQMLSLAQNLSKKELHDAATENVAEIIFDRKSSALQQRLKEFQFSYGMILNYRVDQQSLSQIGGLSGFLLKLFQNYAGIENTNVLTLTGEFSAIEDQVLSDILTYKSYATSDITICKLTRTELDSLDSFYNKQLYKRKLDTTKVQRNPQEISDVCITIMNSYEAISDKNSSCKLNSFNEEKYNESVQGTAQNRADHWKIFTDQIKSKLKGNDWLVNSLSIAPGSNENGTRLPFIDPKSYDTKFILNLNNSLNDCTENDLSVRSTQLYFHTGIRFYFITVSLDFFIPADSLNVFVNDITSELMSNNSDKNYIVGIYLNMQNAALNTQSKTLLVKQNGSWLSPAEIEFARKNNGGTYKEATVFRYKSLLKNIPKPLFICYQVAKVNGLLTTSIIRKAKAAKGKEQIYVHVFKIDKGLEELKQIDDKLTIARQNKVNEMPGQDIVIARLKEERYSTYCRALREDVMVDAQKHVKEMYLHNVTDAQASALLYLKNTYHGKYENDEADEIIENSGLPENYLEGSCKNGESDVVGDYLGIASLLLATVDLDFIPDALLVYYYMDQQEDGKAAEAVLSLFSPGNVSAIKKLLGNSSEVYSAINRGAKISQEGGSYYAIEAEQELLLHSYNIPANNAGNVPKLVSDHSAIARELLPVTAEQAAILVNVEKLPLNKHKEFIEKCFADDVFRKKCLKDPGEVLRWGGMLESFLEQRLAFWEEWINKCFPSKNWANTTFETLGKDYYVYKSTNVTIDAEMRSLFNSSQDAERFLPTIINSGSTNPAKVLAKQNEKFYKIVPKGGNINSPSPYYLSETDFNWIKANPSQLEKRLGLPLSSVSAEYDVFTITSKIDNNAVFQSIVASTRQFSNATPSVIYSSSGGQIQSLILNNANPDFWLKSTSPIETISPKSIPIIGN